MEGSGKDGGLPASDAGGADGLSGPPSSDRGKKVEEKGGSASAGSSKSGEPVDKLLAQLRLTAAEATAVVIDDMDDPSLIDPERAFVGKVLAPNVLHIDTIKSAMRPA